MGLGGYENLFSLLRSKPGPSTPQRIAVLTTMSRPWSYHNKKAV